MRLEISRNLRGDLCGDFVRDFLVDRIDFDCLRKILLVDDVLRIAGHGRAPDQRFAGATYGRECPFRGCGEPVARARAIRLLADCRCVDAVVHRQAVELLRGRTGCVELGFQREAQNLPRAFGNVLHGNHVQLVRNS